MNFSSPDTQALFPFVLSLSKDCTSPQRKEQGLDRLSPNGFSKAEANR
jgi:hypothetical protein